MVKAQWRKTLGGITRTTKDDAAVTLRRTVDGGINVTVTRPQRFGTDIHTGKPTYIWVPVHNHIFNR